MTAIFKKYDKVRISGEEFKASVLAKKNELMKLMQEMQQETEAMAKMTPNSVDYKKSVDEFVENEKILLQRLDLLLAAQVR